ncbi:unnamed protein product [Caenorhabditis auriculariae]|uniref:Uncharacterized protein n=1 Tax=Caenorhabditis auriculariae TaxID=2777116 RepID=A0A8S1HWL9_9PELO|nr:unnamed protein product [Caenorhabditis auriculariae]
MTSFLYIQTSREGARVLADVHFFRPFRFSFISLLYYDFGQTISFPSIFPMSTSSNDAELNLMRQMPSCSRDATATPSTALVDLDIYSWGRIFEHVASGISLKAALALKTIHSEAYRAVERAFRFVTSLKIEIYESHSSSLRVPNNGTTDAVFVVQGTSTRNASKALDMVKFVLARTEGIRNVDLYFEDRDITLLNSILDELISCEKVKLETLTVKRRQGGQSVTKLGELMRSNAKTLRKVSRVGLTEAAIGFNEEMNLEWAALMSFDLGFDPQPGKIPEMMNRLTVSGAKFKHFSYTSFDGFDPNEETVQDLLDKCGVESLKLSMMRGPKIVPRPAYMVGKVRGVKAVELVEIVEHPTRLIKIEAFRTPFEKVFPMAADNITIRQQWN